jgi:hypothetical protein
MAFDFQGNLISVIQVLALILLIIGVYPTRIRKKKQKPHNAWLFKHLALALNLVTVVSVMIPVFSSSITIGGLSILQSTIIWLHAVSGITALVLGFVIIVSWILHPLGELGCSKAWKLMLPTFLILALALILGLTMHIYNIVESAEITTC